MLSNMEKAFVFAGAVVGLAAAAGVANWACHRCRNRTETPSEVSHSAASEEASEPDTELVEVRIEPPPPPPPAVVYVVQPPVEVVEAPPPAGAAAAGIATIFTNLIGFFADVSSEIVRR